MQSTTRTFGHWYDVISKSHTIHRHLFSDFPPFCLPVKEKGMQGRMKGLTRAHWQQICVRDLIFCIVRKIWHYPQTASGSYGREGGNEGVRLADEIRVDFKI